MSSFCTAKATHIFSAKNFSIFAYLYVNFNESLTNDIVSFKQLGPVQSPNQTDYIYWKSLISILGMSGYGDLDIPPEKWLNYLQTVETLIRGHICGL